jgi:diadenosine tetraphosphate (Ap4A) HIT family hydrolase
MSADGCAICGVAAATPEEQIVLRGEHFAVGTGMDVPGWLLLWTLRHEAQGLWELTDEEAAELGPLLRDLSAALQREYGAERTYVMAMGEHALHFHAMVMARPAGAPAEQRGPGLLAAGGALADPAEARSVAARLRDVLAARGDRSVSG